MAKLNSADKKTLNEKYLELKFELFDLEEEYRTLLYLETMPEHDPTYKYCYTTSNRSISYALQSVDSWVRAVIRHMATRRHGHGGALTNATVISVPDFFDDKGLEEAETTRANWITHVTAKLRTQAKIRKMTPKIAKRIADGYVRRGS